MGSRILILGGARFHGRQLALSLAEEGHRVFVLNRGRYTSDYPRSITHLKADRNDAVQLAQALGGRTFDCIYDNNGYNSEQVEILLNSVRPFHGRYVFTSSAAVYLTLASDRPLAEQDATGSAQSSFSPQVKPYAVNKLNAEQYLRACDETLDYTILRFPNIFGPGDFLGKLHYFQYRFRNHRKVLLEEEIRRFSLICVHDAIAILAHVRQKSCFRRVTLNAADPVHYDYETFFSTLFGEEYRRSDVVLAPAEKLRSCGYNLPFAWGPAVDTSTLQGLLGDFEFQPLGRWGRAAVQQEWGAFCRRTQEQVFLDGLMEEHKAIEALQRS